MADDLSNHGRPDRDRINMDEEYEVRDWAKKSARAKTSSGKPSPRSETARTP